MNPTVELWTQERYQQGGESRRPRYLRQPQETRGFKSRPLRHSFLIAWFSFPIRVGVWGVSARPNRGTGLGARGPWARIPPPRPSCLHSLRIHCSRVSLCGSRRPTSRDCRFSNEVTLRGSRCGLRQRSLRAASREAQALTGREPPPDIATSEPSGYVPVFMAQRRPS